jgi:hypothetical protein
MRVTLKDTFSWYIFKLFLLNFIVSSYVKNDQNIPII